jgi:hypothetical protein
MAKSKLEKVLNVFKKEKKTVEKKVAPSGFNPELPENKQREYR